MSTVIDLYKPGKSFIFLLALVLYSAVSFYYLDKYPPVYGDETLYSEPCIDFLQGKGFTTKIYQPFFGFDKTNLIQGRIFSFFQLFSFYLFGINVTAMRVQPFLAGLGALWMTYLISKELFSKKTIAIFSMVFLSLSHMFVFTSHFSRPDITLTFFILCSVYLFISAGKKQTNLLYFFSGLMAGLSPDVHPSGNIAILTVVGLTIQRSVYQRRDWKMLFNVVAGVSAGIFWWIFWHILWNPKLFFEQAQFLKVYSYGQMPLLFWPFLTMIKQECRRWYDFFWLGAYHRNMFLLLLFGLSIFRAISKWKKEEERIILTSVFCCVLGLMMTTANKTAIFVIYPYPFILILVSVFLYESFTSEFSRKKKIACALGGAFFFFLFLENFSKINFYRSDYNSYINKIKEQIPKSASVFITDNLSLGLRDHTDKMLVNLVLHFKRMLDGNNVHLEYFAGGFEDFLKRSKVEYIVADNEMLGWPQQKEDLNRFIEGNCSLVAQIEDPFYNFSTYLNKKSPQPLITKIYRVN